MAANDTPKYPVVSNDRLQLINKDLLNEQELSTTLAELTDLESDHPVDLAKNLEANQAISSLKKSAYSFLGARYRFGGTSRSALDCSSFTQQVFREQSVKLPVILKKGISSFSKPMPAFPHTSVFILATAR